MTAGRQRPRRSPVAQCAARAATGLCAGLLALVLAGSAAEAGIRIDDSVSTVEAMGADVLALSAAERAHLAGWISRGGRLVLWGDAREAGLVALVPAGCRDARSGRLGLGEVVTLLDPEDGPPAGGSSISDALAREATRLTAPPPPERRLRSGLGLRLGGYAVLLAAGWLVAAGRGRAARALGAASLVAAFAGWPMWASATPWSADRRAQVDVVIDTGCGPAQVWSAATIDAGSRATRRIATARSGDAAAAGREVLELARGQRASLAWRSEIGPDDPALIATASGGGGAVLVRNGFDHAWGPAWLLLPGRAPVPLGSIDGRAAGLTELPAPAAGAAVDPLAALALEPDPSRGRLLRAAGPPAEALLARGEAVLVAWADAPVRPAVDERHGAFGSGSTLWIAALRGRP